MSMVLLSSVTSNDGLFVVKAVADDHGPYEKYAI